MTCEFFQFTHETSAPLARWEPGSVQLASVKCPKDSGHQRAAGRESELKVRLAKWPAEAVTWTWHNEVLIRLDVFKALQRSGLTGFQSRQADARDADGREEHSPPLVELVVVGFAGHPGERSGARLLQHCSDCGYERYSPFERATELIDRERWDGSDFFLVHPFDFVFVSEKAAAFLRAYKCSGVKITRLEDLHDIEADPMRMIRELSQKTDPHDG